MLKLYQKQLLKSFQTCSYSVAVPATKEQVVKRAKGKKTKSQQDTADFYISCKRKEFNLKAPKNEDQKQGSIALASKGWLHNKSKGDYFIIHPLVSGAALQSEMQDIQSYQATLNIKLDSSLLKNLNENFNITQLTEIQTLAMPKILDNHHVLLAAETGCGKTLAYLLPIVQKIMQLKQSSQEARKMNTPLALIITPGRELATQIGSVAEKLCADTDIQVKTVLGGNTKRLMLNPEFADVDILVASIGGLSKLITTGIYRVQQVRHIVLDEADTLMDDSFAEKLEHLLKRFPLHKNHIQDERTWGTQLILASATLPTNVDERLQHIIDTQTLHQVTSKRLHLLLPHIEQRFKRVTKADRPMHLLELVKMELMRKRPLLIFSNKSATCDYVSLFLNNNGINCLNLNGDMLMKIRLGRFEQYQRGECDVLSTTDVASRGLDTCRTQHVVNFDFPLHTSDYIHRSGRIGRVGNLLQKGVVTNLISSRREISLVQQIEHAARVGAVLPNVNANIKNLINQRIIEEMRQVEQQDMTKSRNKQEDEYF